MASKSDAQTSSNFEDYEEIFGRIPEAYFNAHRYLYTNGIEISEGTKEVPLIYHSDDKFEFDLPVSDVDVESIGIQLVAEFSEDVLVTRVGIRGIESYFGRPEVRIAVFVRKGDITTCTAKEKALQYTHFPPENFSQVVRKEQHIDFGRAVHIHAHPGHFLEFKTHWTGDVVLENTSVFVRVQAPKRVGGPYDHWSWSPDSVARDRSVKSLGKYNKYRFRDDSDDIATR